MKLNKLDITKNKHITFRLPRQQFEQLQKIANKHFKSVSEYIRDAVLHEIKKDK